MTRDPEGTREALLDAAFWEFYRNGFQGTGLEAILARASVTKGALYHHFGSKKELGYAVVDELLSGWFQRLWVEPLSTGNDPVEDLKRLIANLEKETPPEACELGCPLNNLAQEMSPLDEGFRTRIQGIYQVWLATLASALRRGQVCGTIRQDLEVEPAAALIVAAFQGATGLGKIAQDRGGSGVAMAGLISYLESLRVVPVVAA